MMNKTTLKPFSDSSSCKETTDFGFQRIPIRRKNQYVADVFDRVAPGYDIMNDLMSLGLHRLWKRLTVDTSAVRPGQSVLDVAGGTGDLAIQFAQRVGRDGHVVLADINANMIEQGRDRCLNKGILSPLHYVQADAESLPFSDNSFDCVCVAFGLRNVTDKMAALSSMYRVLNPGGQLLILEFSQPTHLLWQFIYDHYSFTVLPRLGQWVLGDANSYRYLVESIRRHPNQDTLKSMMQEAGFNRCSYVNLTGGVVALHRGYKMEGRTHDA